MLLTLDVIYLGQTYRLPNLKLEATHDQLYTIRKSIDFIFKDLFAEHPDEEIHVTWDNDRLKMKINSKYMPERMIYSILYKLHGIKFG